MPSIKPRPAGARRAWLRSPAVLSAGLMFTPLEEVVANLAEFFADIQRQCARIHTAIYEVYITYPVEAAIEA